MKRKKTNSGFSFLNLNKPAGMSSFDCIFKLRKITGIKKMGHLGTLDPSATGVLPIALGKATRLIPYVEKQFKFYRSTIRLGVKTNTDDMDGTILESKEVPTFSLEEISQVLESFTGEIQQVPPQVSAVHINGERAYKRARKGEKFDIKPVLVTVHSIEILEYNHPLLTIDVKVGGGTYIRSIARDLGEKLGCGGAVETLSRLQDGSFKIEDSHTLEEIAKGVQEDTLEDLLTPPHLVLTNLDKIIVNEKGIKEISFGKPVGRDEMEPGYYELIDDDREKRYFLLDKENSILAIARTKEEFGKLYMERVFAAK